MGQLRGYFGRRPPKRPPDFVDGKPTQGTKDAIELIDLIDQLIDEEERFARGKRGSHAAQAPPLERPEPCAVCAATVTYLMPQRVFASGLGWVCDSCHPYYRAAIKRYLGNPVVPVAHWMKDALKEMHRLREEAELAAGYAILRACGLQPWSAPGTTSSACFPPRAALPPIPSAGTPTEF